MVFRIENEVGADNGDADGDDHEDEEDNFYLQQDKVGQCLNSIHVQDQ